MIAICSCGVGGASGAAPHALDFQRALHVAAQAPQPLEILA